MNVGLLFVSQKMLSILASRINQIKAKQQALRSDGFKNSRNLQGFLKTVSPKRILLLERRMS